MNAPQSQLLLSAFEKIQLLYFYNIIGYDIKTNPFLL